MDGGGGRGGRGPGAGGGQAYGPADGGRGGNAPAPEPGAGRGRGVGGGGAVEYAPIRGPAPPARAVAASAKDKEAPSSSGSVGTSIERVRLVRDVEMMAGGEPAKDQHATMYVWGITEDVTESDVDERFKEFGQVKHVKIHSRESHEGQAKRYAFVELSPKPNFTAKDIQKELTGKPLKEGKIRVADVSEIKDAEPDKGFVEYDIDDKQQGYIEFITRLRKQLMKDNGVDVDIFDDGKSGALRVLAKQPSSENPAQWIKIRLTANNKGGGKSTTTLAVRKDNLYVKGFMNNHLTKEENAEGKRKDRWYELPGTDKNDPPLPGKYEATPLSWGSVEYKNMMNLKSTHQVKQTLECTMLGKAFAERAVRRLSRYHPKEVENADENPTRLGLAGLVVMILEAARMNPVLDTIAGGWNGGTGLTSRMSSIMWDWGSMSAALLYWKKSHYKKWPVKCRYALADALASICLVNNSNSGTGKGSGGQSRVEILSVDVVSADADVIINKISVEDSNLKQDIYQQNNNDEGCSLELIVLEPTKRISAYESFDIQFLWTKKEHIETSDGQTKTFFKKKDTTRTWDCLKQDAERETVELVKRSVLLDSRCKLEVTYFVMSNIATKNEVKVRLIGSGIQVAEILNLKGKGKEQSAEEYSCTVCGTITAYIDGFEQHPIVLFKSAPEGLTVKIPPDGYTLPLTRSDVPVPRDMKLHINTTDLCITGAKACACARATHQPQPAVLSYDFGCSEPQNTDTICCSRKQQVQVSIAWEGEGEEQRTKATKSSLDVECMIEDNVDSFTKSIENLRENLGAGEPFHEHQDQGEKIWLTRKPGEKPKCIRIKMKAGDHQTTLAILEAYCFGVGFLNQSGVWYESRGGLLPPEYNSVPLGWGVNYTKILMLRAGVRDSQDMKEVNKLLDSAMLGTKSFAEKAVRTLSRYPDVDEEDDLLIKNQRVALAGLIIMVCESARYGSVLNHFKVNWRNDEKSFSRKMEYSYDWYSISRDLLLRKKNNETWPENDEDVRLVYSGANK